MDTINQHKEQKITPQKIEESKKKLQNIFNNSPSAIAIFDGPEHRFVMANLAYQKQNNRKEKDFLGKSFCEVFPELEGTGSFELFDNVYKTGETFTASEYAAMIDSDNNGIPTQRYFNFSLEALKNELKEIYGVMVMAFDITEHVVAKKIIQESEVKYRTLFTSIDQGFLLGEIIRNNEGKGIDYYVHQVNDTYEKQTGINKDLVLGKTVLQAFPTIDKWWIETYAAVVDNQCPVRFEKFFEFTNRWFEIKASPAGEEMFIILFTDITERILAVEKIKASEQQFSTLANNIQNLAWIADGGGYIYWYNQRWYDYTGTTLEEMKGQGWEKVHHPDHVKSVIDFVQKAWHINEPFELTFPLRAANGEYRWFLTRAFPVNDEQGKISNWIGTNTDITEQKTFAEQLEIKVEERTAELNSKNEQLETLNKELQSFAYISSHDLQEPLRKIQTFSTRILESEESKLSDDGKDMFKRMQNAAKRMQALIEDLLAYSHTNSEERKFENTDLKKIVEEVRDDLKEELNDKHATIKAIELCEVHIIRFQFRQLLHNLIGNSLKFAHPQHPPHIKIEGEIAKGIKFNNEKLLPEKKYCHISISDNGIGFEQKYSEKIFEVFQRLHGKEEYNGTGIGLAIVKKIVENHNGIITATGELNKGATFEIYIPVV